MRKHNVRVKHLMMTMCYCLLFLSSISVFIEPASAASGTAEKVADILDGNEYDVFVEGQYAYIACGWGGLRIYDISNPSLPSIYSELDDIGDIRGVHVEGDFAYLAAGEEGLKVVDINDLKNPRFLVSHSTPNVNDEFAYEVEIQGEYAFIAEGDDGLEIINISNPIEPRGISSYDLVGNHITNIDVNGSYVYITNFNKHRIEVIDISSIYFPSRISTYSDGNQWGIEDVCVVGDYVLVADSSDGLEILNMSDPHNPEEIGNYTNPYHVNSVCGNTTHAYISSSFGMEILDITNPTSPYRTGYVSTDFWSDEMCLAGEIVLTASSYTGGVSIYDISDSAHPSLLDSFDDGVEIEGMAVEGETVFVAGVNGIYSINVSDPYNPEIENLFDEKYLYSVGSSPGYCYSFSNKEFIVVNSTTMTHNASYFIPETAYISIVQFPHAIMFHSSSDEGIFFLLNISDPSHLELLDEYHFEQDYYELVDAEIEGDLLYVIGTDWDIFQSKLYVFDISDPINILEITNVVIEWSWDMCVEGDRVYLATEEGLKILDVSTPGTPQLIVEYNLPYTVYNFESLHKIEVVNEIAFIGVSRGIAIVDVYDLEEISMLVYYECNYPNSIVYQEGYLYFTSYFDGLEILKINLDLSDRKKIPGFPFYSIAGVSFITSLLIIKKRLHNKK